MIAIIVAIASWFRPVSEPEAQAAEQQFSEQEVADAKEAMCEAWDKTYAAIKNVASKTTNDQTLNYVLILETQVIFHASGDYIRSELDRSPATPAKLAESFGELVSSYHQIVIARLADAPESEIDPIKVRMDAAGDFVKRECE